MTATALMILLMNLFSFSTGRLSKSFWRAIILENEDTPILAQASLLPRLSS
jgi:hypothetical protein